MHLGTIFRSLLIPLRGAPLVTVIVFALLAALALRAGILGIPLMLIVVSWFFKYSFVMLDNIVDGRREVPALSAEMVNPVEQRPFGMLLLVIIFYVATMSLESSIGATGVQGLRVIGAGIVPAMVAAMSINGRFVDALNPLAVFAVIARMPLAYFGLLAVIAAIWWVPIWIFGLFAADAAIPAVLLALLAMYLWLAMMASIGTVVYEHREDLGYEPAESPERTAARDSTELERERDKLMDPIFAEFRGGSFANAGASVRAIVEKSSRPLEEFRWLYARAKRWPDPRLAEYLAQIGLPLLMTARANGEALDLMRDRLKANPAFRPLQGAQLLRMAMLARDAGDKPTARALVADFATRYPSDPGISVAMRLADELRR